MYTKLWAASVTKPGKNEEKTDALPMETRNLVESSTILLKKSRWATNLANLDDQTFGKSGKIPFTDRILHDSPPRGEGMDSRPALRDDPAHRQRNR
jgi:hypothetical protein